MRRGRGRRVRVERRVVPVSADPERRLAVLERELWRIAVENLNYSEQHAWAALAGARVTTNNWRRAKAMLQHDQAKELRRRFLLTCVQRNRNHQLRLKALAEIAALRDAEAFDDAVEVVATWPRDERRAGAKLLLQALAERRIGRRDQAQAWVWRLAGITRELHEEYAVQRWPETKRLLGLFVNSSGRAHGRNARRIVHAARQQDRRLAISLLAASVAHTPEAEEVLRGARMRMARKPSAVARELLRNFPKSGGGKRRRRRGKNGSRPQKGGGNGADERRGERPPQGKPRWRSPQGVGPDARAQGRSLGTERPARDRAGTGRDRAKHSLHGRARADRGRARRVERTPGVRRARGARRRHRDPRRDRDGRRRRGRRRVNRRSRSTRGLRGREPRSAEQLRRPALAG